MSDKEQDYGIHSLSENEKAALKELKERLSQKLKVLDFRLFGSKARGESDPDSDIDVMLVLENETPEISRQISKIAYEMDLKYDLLISIVTYTRSDLEDGPFSESPLYKNAMKEGIPL